MSWTWVLVTCVALFTGMIVAIHGFNVLRDIRIMRWTGRDPREDPTAVADAARKVRGKPLPNDGRDSIGGA